MAAAEPSTPRWSALPGDLLRLCLRQLASDSGGMSVPAAQELLACVTLNREWRAAAREELRVQVHADSPAHLTAPVLQQLSLTALRLPNVVGDERAAEAAIAGLLTGPAFVRRQRRTLASLSNVPLAVAASGVLAAWSGLQHLSIADAPYISPPWRGAALAARCLPRALTSLGIPARLFASGQGPCSVPPAVQRLRLFSPADIIVTGEHLDAAPLLEIDAGATVGFLPDALSRPRRCRSLAISARFASFYCSQRTQFDAAGCSASSPSDGLHTWARFLAPLLECSGLRQLTITAHTLSRYCCSTGRLRSLASGSQLLEPPEACGLAAAQLSWPVAGRPPAFCSLTLTAL